jgi:sugar phosphate isomerase/epimerase
MDEIILASGSIGSVPFQDRVSAAAAGGFDGIGLSVWEYERLQAEGQDSAAMREALKRHGPRLMELEVFLGFAASEEAKRGEALPGVNYTDPQETAVHQVVGGRLVPFVNVQLAKLDVPKALRRRRLR